MNNGVTNSLVTDLLAFASKLGQDRMLVQGIGGNFSVKVGDTLWVKASGKRFRDSLTENVIVGVQLNELRKAIYKQQYDFPIQLIESSLLRPSIETMLHAIMPHRYVFHLHDIASLSLLITYEDEPLLMRKLKDWENWKLIDYYAPGANLAGAVAQAMRAAPDTSTLFLRNHGVVLGADTLDVANSQIRRLNGALATQSDAIYGDVFNRYSQLAFKPPMSLVRNIQIQQLVLDERYYSHLATCWAVSPDHVIFLGSAPHVVDGDSRLSTGSVDGVRLPTRAPYLFDKRLGVHATEFATDNSLEMLEAYSAVLPRALAHGTIRCLTNHQIHTLLIDPKEHFRISQSV